MFDHIELLVSVLGIVVVGMDMVVVVNYLLYRCYHSGSILSYMTKRTCLVRYGRLHQGHRDRCSNDFRNGSIRDHMSSY